MKFLKELTKIYTTNFQFHLQMLRLGTSVEVPSIDGGKSKIKIPAGTQHGKQFRLRGKGMPVLRGSAFGDLYIRINTQVPTSLN